MALTTYAELKTAIGDFLNRDDLTSVAPDFISLAEADINRRVRHWRMEGRATHKLIRSLAPYPRFCRSFDISRNVWRFSADRVVEQS